MFEFGRIVYKGALGGALVTNLGSAMQFQVKQGMSKPDFWFSAVPWGEKKSNCNFVDSEAVHGEVNSFELGIVYCIYRVESWLLPSGI